MTMAQKIPRLPWACQVTPPAVPENKRLIPVTRRRRGGEEMPALIKAPALQAWEDQWAMQLAGTAPYIPASARLVILILSYGPFVSSRTQERDNDANRKSVQDLIARVLSRPWPGYAATIRPNPKTGKPETYTPALWNDRDVWLGLDAKAGAHAEPYCLVTVDWWDEWLYEHLAELIASRERNEWGVPINRGRSRRAVWT